MGRLSIKPKTMKFSLIDSWWPHGNRLPKIQTFWYRKGRIICHHVTCRSGRTAQFLERSAIMFIMKTFFGGGCKRTFCCYDTLNLSRLQNFIITVISFSNFLRTLMVEIFCRKIKCNGDRRSDFVCRCKIWKRKLLKILSSIIIILPIWLNKIFSPVPIPISNFAECFQISF